MGAAAQRLHQGSISFEWTGKRSDDSTLVMHLSGPWHLQRDLPSIALLLISTLTLVNLFGGIIKGTFYGVLIAVAGCLRGFQCGNSFSAVGDAATQAVVMAIVMIVVACGLFAVVFNFLGI
jgi:permease MlaE